MTALDIENTDMVVKAIGHNTEALDEVDSTLGDIRDVLIDVVQGQNNLREELRSICRMLSELTTAVETVAASITRAEMRR